VDTDSSLEQPAWRDRVVLVTGARGFIGGHLCRSLLQAGAVVVGASRSVVHDETSGIQWVEADCGDSAAALQLLQRTRPDVVFHLAGHVTGSQDIEHVAPTLLHNLNSTVHILTAAAQTGKPRVILAGSMQEPDPGDACPVPCSPYAASKWACAGYARMFAALYGLRVTIARPFMVYGPGQWALTKVLPYSIVTLLRGDIPNLASGARELDWVFVEDVVQGLLAVADSPEAHTRTIDLGTGRLMTVRAVVELVARTVGVTSAARFGAVADRPLERPHAARADDTERVLGWRAATPLQVGISRTIEWYRTQLAAGLL